MPSQIHPSGDKNCKGLWRRPRVWFLLGIPLGGFLMFFAGAAALGAFNGIMEQTNTLAFCTSCHEIQPAYDSWKPAIIFHR